jgi:hypothetical protein
LAADKGLCTNGMVAENAEASPRDVFSLALEWRLLFPNHVDFREQTTAHIDIERKARRMSSLFDDNLSGAAWCAA